MQQSTFRLWSLFYSDSLICFIIILIYYYFSTSPDLWYFFSETNGKDQASCISSDSGYSKCHSLGEVTYGNHCLPRRWLPLVQRHYKQSTQLSATCHICISLQLLQLHESLRAFHLGTSWHCAFFFFLVQIVLYVPPFHSDSCLDYMEVMRPEGAMLTGINGAVTRKQLNVINVSISHSLCILIPKGKRTYSSLKWKTLECG